MGAFTKRPLVDYNLYGSEYSQKIGLAMMISIGLSFYLSAYLSVCLSNKSSVFLISIPLMSFVISPYTIRYITGPSALISLFITVILYILVSLHFSEIMTAVPKNNSIYLARNLKFEITFNE